MSRPTDTRTTLLVELLAATADGDKTAFARLYRLTSPKLFAIALRILKQETRAQECLQESYLSVWRQAAIYQPGKASPMTWLVTITRNRAIDLLRKQRSQPITEGAEIETFCSPGNPVSLTDQMAMQKCLDELKEAQQDCIRLAYFEGLTHPELAERLKLPVGTIKTWIRRGLQQLRQCLES